MIRLVGPLVIRALGATWRVRRVGPNPFADRRSGVGSRRCVVAFWHNTLLPLAYVHRDEGATVLVSRHGDGEFIARALEGLGYRVARGSTTRGGALGLRELLATAKRGAGDLAITPDGPKGPPLVAQHGTAYLAAATGFAILPLALASSSAWRFRSWDRFQVPKPFARVVVVAGTPIDVPRDAIAKGLAPYCRRFEEEMARALVDAERTLAEQRSRA